MRNISAMRFTVPKGNRYTVQLLFQENRWDKLGQRVFKVTVEGKPVIFDGKILRKPLDPFDFAKRYNPFAMSAIVLVEDGVLDIEFEAVNDQPILNAIKVQNVGKLRYDN